MKNSLKFLSDYPTFSITYTNVGEIPLTESRERIAYLEKRLAMLEEIMPHLLAVREKIPFIIESNNGEEYFTFFKPHNFRIRLERCRALAGHEFISGMVSENFLIQLLDEVKKQVVTEISILNEIAIN